MSDTNGCEFDEESGETALSMEELMTWLIKDLKAWCSHHHLHVSGKKNVLAKRVYRAMHSANRSSEEDEEYDVPAQTMIRPTTWKTVTTDNIPPIRDNDVKNYFVYHKNPVSGARLTFERQLRKARKFTSERYVTNVDIGQGTDDMSFIRAKCQASMKDAQYSVTVCLVTETGMVQTGECTCKAGQSGVCAHVGALLLTLVKICDACTSQACQWKAAPTGSIKLDPQQICDIRIFNPEKDNIAKHRPYPGIYSAGPTVDPGVFVEDLLDAINTCNSDCALYRTMRGTPGDISSFLSLFDVPFSYRDSVDLTCDSIQQVFQDFTSSLKVTRSMLDNLEKSTRGQGININWKKARSLVVTASHMGSIVKRQKLELDALVKAIMYPTIIAGVKSLNHGNKMETKARQDYARWHMKKCGGVSIEDRGLVVSQDLPFIGASIDGSVQCPKCGNGIVELKCPYGTKQQQWRNMTPEVCAESPNFCCTLQDGKLKLKKEHQYMYQVQGQMGVCQQSWVDFVIWTKRGISVERIEADTSLWTSRMVPKLHHFFVSGMVVELFSRRIQRGKKLNVLHV
jgi:hypothetical protein